MTAQQEFKFGVEIECFFPTQTPEDFFRELRKLKCVVGDDGSIQPPLNHRSAEIKTPPILFSKFEEFINKLDPILKKYTVEANTSCGLHVHTSHPNFFKKRYLKRINLTWLAIEDVLFTLQNPNRMYNTYCRRKWFDYIKRGGLPAFGKTRQTLLRNLNMERDSLNFRALSRHGTIECRTHTGTADTKRILNWVRLLNQFYDYCLKRYKEDDIKRTWKMECAHDKVLATWDILNLDLELRKYFTDHVKKSLFSRLNKQTDGAKRILMLNSKIKWYKSKFKVQNMRTPQTSYQYTEAPIVATPVILTRTPPQKDPTKSRPYKSWLKLEAQKTEILRRINSYA